MKPVLDVTCSIKRAWPPQADVRMDVRALARPDVRADARMLPFKDVSIGEIWCDPPHLVSFDGDVRWPKDFHWAGEDFARFSFWPNRKAWLDFLGRSSLEFRLVLKPDGRVFYKVPDGSLSHGRMILVRDVLNRFGSIGFVLERSERKLARGPMAQANVNAGKSASAVYYLTFHWDGRTVREPITLESFAEELG